MQFKKYLKSAIAGFTAFAMVATMLPANGIGRVEAAATDSSMILHWDMSTNDDKTLLTDVTGNHHDGKLVDSVALSEIDKIKVLDMTGGHVVIPDQTIGSDMTEITVNMLVKIAKNIDASWMWCLGSSNKHYMYFTGRCSTPQGSRMRGGIGYVPNDSITTGNGWDYETEIHAANSGDSLPINEWQNITVTYKDGDKFIFYKNGEKQAEISMDDPNGKAGTFTLQDLMTSPGLEGSLETELDGYMGWSLYGGKDPKFEGKVADFRIYNKSMSQEEVTELYGELDTRLQNLSKNDFSADDVDLKEEDCLGSNTSKDKVETDLSLPTKTTIKGDTTNTADITGWVSSDPATITNDGKVTRSTSNKTVTMTATVTRGSVTVKKDLTFKVPRNLTEEEIFQLDVDELTILNKDDIRGNIYLPTDGKNGSKITWTSSDENIISSKDNGAIAAGKVNRQAKDTKVTLTATLTKDSFSATKDIECTVRKAYKTPETTDYIFAYFPYTDAGGKDERIYFGVSEDGLNFSALNDQKYVLESKMGTHGLRDPFIIRSHEGDKFYLIATDLTVAGLEQDGVKYPGQGWGDNQVKGSQSIMVWESTDLVNWSDQRMCKVAVDNAGCTWAPEAYWDDETEQYVVFWASKTGTDNYSKQRLYFATTRDFSHFSDPQVWIDADGSVIDTTVIKVGDYYYRFTKNEAGSANTYGTPSKHVFCEKSTSLTSSNWELVYKDSLAEGTTWAIEGPCIYKFNSEDRARVKELAGLKDITLDDSKDLYGLIADRNGSYIFPGVSDDISTGKFYRLGDNKSAEVDGVSVYSMPEPIASHGTIMPITSEEYNNLRLKWDSAYKTKATEYINMANSAADQITLDTKVTSDLNLPTSAKDDAAISNVTISWASSDESVITSVGKVTRPAYNKGDATVTLTATVTAKSNDPAVRDQSVTKEFDVTVEKLPQKFTVTFNSDGGSKVAKQTVESGKTVKAPKNPTKKNYTFAGWYNGKTKYNFKSKVTKNLTLKAKWTKVTVATPKASKLKNAKSKQMTVTIPKVSGAAGYQVTYSTDKKFKKKATKTAEGTKNVFTIKKLSKTTYYVKVKAFKKDSTGKKIYSKFSKVSTIKIKK